MLLKGNQDTEESLKFSSRVLQVVIDVLIPSTIQDLPDR